MSTWAWVSVACFFLAAGVGLWGYAQQQQTVSKISDRVQRVLDAAPTEPVPLAWQQERQRQLHAVRGLGFAPQWLQDTLTAKQWAWLVGSCLLATALLAWWSSLLIAVILPVMVVSVTVFVAWLRWQRLRARIVQQLPSFIDGMVRMVVLGHATQSAFVLAAAAAKEPLAPRMAKAAAFAKAGMPIDQALDAATKDLALTEFSLLSAVIQVGARFGGRVDGLLERVAHLMRDREQAERELKALSAEVRVSAWVLSLLPVLVGGAIIILNASYFMKMWDDPTGRWIALGGLGLQLLGSLVLYRMARLEDA